MSSSPKTQKFSAWINLMPGTDSKIIVVGEVETSASNNLPVLTRTDPQGIIPEHLLLDLSIIEAGEDGTQDIRFRPVRYEEPASQGQFTTVSIQWMGEVILTLDVTEAH